LELICIKDDDEKNFIVDNFFQSLAPVQEWVTRKPSTIKNRVARSRKTKKAKFGLNQFQKSQIFEEN
jgi:hypothetical protein